MAHPHEGQPVEIEGAALHESQGVIIMVHGRNAGPRNILSLVPALNRPGFTYVAPAAANGTWYPFSFLEDTAKNEPGLSSGLRVLDTLIDELIARGIDRRRIMLLGFSQGACLAGEFSIRHPGRYGGLIMLSGGLIGPPGTTWRETGSFEGMPVFLGCSDVDAHIPITRVEESAAVFSRMGADVTTRIYPGMGHLVSDDEIAQTQALMDRVAPVRSVRL